MVASLAPRPERIPHFEPDGEVSFLLAQTVAVDSMWHQELLELRDEEARLDRLDTLFRAALEGN